MAGKGKDTEDTARRPERFGGVRQPHRAADFPRSNLAGLAILIVGAMFLNEMRAGFVVSKKQDLVAQAQIFTSLLV